MKKQCVIEHNEDDEYLAELAEEAEESMANFLGYDLHEIEDEEGRVPVSIRRALYMMVNDMYSHRGIQEGFQQYENPAFRFLTQSYVRYAKRR